MKSITNQFINHLKAKNFEIFTLQTLDEVDVLKHTETSNGMSIQSLICFDDSPCTEITYLLANCTNKLKQEQIILYLNELNRQRKMKYNLSETGNIIASFIYWADDNAFNPETLLEMYIGFFRSLLEEGELPKLMRMIWG